MPAQKPGRSKQDYGTPQEFLASVKSLLRIEDFYRDLAASAENAVTRRYYTEEMNALSLPWGRDDARFMEIGDSWNWLNPPFANIKPWVERAEFFAHEQHAQTAMLVPASVGSNWWRDYVHQKCGVLFLNGRLTFVGETKPYPKDCALLLYSPVIRSGYQVWNWREQ